jgi:serine/threonine protein kinase/WD40 repeat protein
VDANPIPPSHHESQLDRIVAEYLQLAEQGAAPDQDHFIAQHPEFTTELKAFFADAGQLQALVGPRPLSPSLADTAAPSSESSSALAPGSLVRYFGDYEILEELGTGGMGVVYKARQHKLQRIVALKLIKAGVLAGPTEIQRFQAEARAAARLDHPGIVSVHEVGIHAGQHFFTMDYVAGGSLARLHRDQPVPARRAADLVNQLARAVQYAHQQGIVHRDLKPANVLLTTSGAPRITDFGLAKQLWTEETSEPVSMTETGQILGTAGYMAPEQAAGKSRLIGPPADIYALGAILYALLTGRAPFVGESQADTIMQVLHNEPVSPRALNPGISRDLETICLKCLEKEPHKRYGTAELLADDLTRFSTGRPVLARPISQISRAWRWCRRNPIVAALTAALAAALLAGTIVSTSFALAARASASAARSSATRAHAAKIEADDQRRVAEEQRNIASDRLYISDMRLADRALGDHALSRMQRLLDGHQPALGVDRRAWEWFYIRSKAFGADLTFDRHQWFITGIAWHPDGKRIASASEEGRIEIWDSSTEQIQTTITLPKKLPCRLAWNRSGTLLLGAPWWHSAMTAQAGLMVYVWKSDTGTVELAAAAQSAEWDPAGDHLAILSPAADSRSQGMIDSQAASRRIVNPTRLAEIKIWDAQSRATAAIPNWKDNVAAAAWSPDGSQLALADYRATVQVVNVTSGEVASVLRGHSVPPTCLAFDLDGKQLATASADGTIRLWQTTTGEQTRSWTGKNAYPVRLVWSPTGKRFAVRGVESPGFGAKDAVLVVDVEAEAPVFQQLAWNFAWSADGQLLALALPDKSIGVWRVSDWQRRNELVGHIGRVFEIAWSADNSRLATGATDRTVKIWKTPAAPKEAIAARPLINFSPLAWDPSGAKLAHVDPEGAIQVIEHATRQSVATLPQAKGTGGVCCLAWSPSGTYLACGTNTNIEKGRVEIWQLGAEKPLHSVDGGDFTHVAWSPDGARLYMLCRHRFPADSQLRIFDAEGGVELPPAPAPHLGDAIAWSGDGRQYAHNLNRFSRSLETRDDQGKLKSIQHIPDPERDGVVIVRNAQTHSEVTRLSGLGLVGFLQFANRPHHLAVSGSNEVQTYEVSVWDLQSRDRVCTLESYGRVMAFHSTDDRLIAGSGKSLALWHVSSGQELLALDAADNAVAAAAWRPDGKVLATTSDRGHVEFWDASSGYDHASPLPPDYFRTREFGGGGFF